jgi:predicted  nucleic acid-binding Zn-ribbon protein
LWQEESECKFEDGQNETWLNTSVEDNFKVLAAHLDAICQKKELELLYHELFVEKIKEEILSLRSQIQEIDERHTKKQKQVSKLQ